MQKPTTFIISILYVLILQSQPLEKKLFTINKDSSAFSLTIDGAMHLASLPLKCLQQEYPNKTNHTSESDTDHMLTPKKLHPVFYGCFDWHSSVHGHWMLIKLLKDFPDLPNKEKIITSIAQNITKENVEQEISYFKLPLAKTWERTYGWAWLLKLQQELVAWKNPKAIEWRNNLQPLCDTIISLWMNFLPKQTYANRTGIHPNTAFGMVLALDYAKATHNNTFEKALIQSARKLFLTDTNAPVVWEPNGSDFLSPSLEEADLMRRVLPKNDFIQWFNNWLNNDAIKHLTKLPVVSDRNDYQIVHLDGLCFSRSWCMKGIANQLPTTDKRKKILMQSAIKHLNASLSNIANGSYGGEHWLASFAVYALTTN